MWTEIVLFILEIIGTIAFSISGAFVAIRVKFDIFGVVVLGCITAVGGGIMRDVLIGATPPAIFSKAYIIGVAACAALVVFLVAYFKRKQFEAVRETVESVNNVFDSIGLAAFTVMGTELAFSQGLANNAFLSVTLGVLTGVGGGVLRDILTQTLPSIFKKHVYALVSIVGAIFYYLLRNAAGNTVLPTCIAAIFIITMRILAAKYRWELPKITAQEKQVLPAIEKQGSLQELQEDNPITIA